MCLVASFLVCAVQTSAGDSDQAGVQFFESRVRPRLAHPDVRTLGQVGGAAKAHFLGRARALLFPIGWEEPFGLVMIEAMMCGTPVVALARGSVPEVVEDGITGFVCRDAAELATRLGQLDGFDLVIHMGHPRLVIEPLARQAPATIDVLRWRSR